MLDECIAFLEERSKNSSFYYEIIIVSDGSTDKTVEVGQKYAEQLGTEKMRVLALERNRGKGGAVRLVGKCWLSELILLILLLLGDPKCQRGCFVIC